MENTLVKIKTNKPNRFNAKVSISNILVTFNAIGVAEVPEDKVDFLLSKDTSLCIEGQERKVIVDEEEKTDKKEDVSKEDFSKSLALMKVEELKAFCETSELPNEEWESLKKMDLIKYIVTKIKQ